MNPNETLKMREELREKLTDLLVASTAERVGKSISHIMAIVMKMWNDEKTKCEEILSNIDMLMAYDMTKAQFVSYVLQFLKNEEDQEV